MSCDNKNINQIFIIMMINYFFSINNIINMFNLSCDTIDQLQLEEIYFYKQLIQ